MSFTPLFILNTIIFGTFIGLQTKNIYYKIGRNPKTGFLIGFLLQGLGLMISLSLSPKNDYKPKSTLTKRVLLGIGRFFVFSIMNQIIIIEMLDNSDVLMLVGPLIYADIKYVFILLGLTWIMRGNNNFLKLG
tara:strand:- start:86 stop:484 length:399 start_codon:yes stop_codon:yes gene_type:complete